MLASGTHSFVLHLHSHLLCRTNAILMDYICTARYAENEKWLRTFRRLR